MGGSVAGGLGGAALGSVIPGVGTALGATLGGLAGSGISNLVGGSSGGGLTNRQPGTGTSFQVFQPGAQPSEDLAWQNLQTTLYNIGQGGLQSLGGVGPAQAVYPQASQIAGYQAAQTDPAVGGYGYYGGVPIRQELSGLQTLQNLQNTPYNLTNYGQQAGAAGLADIPQTQAAAFNPQIAQLVQNIIGNPYNQQALQGAQTAAGIGGQAAGLTPQQINLLNTLGIQLPGQGQQAAATTTGQIPLLQQLAQGSAARGTDLSGQAQGLVPQLQQLYGQTVPGLLQAGGQYAAQAGATTPALQRIGALGEDLAGQAGGLSQQAQSLAPQLQQIAGLGTGLAGQAGGYAQQAAATNAGLADAQQRILQTGQDPQGALFNQLTQQTRDQANAINAISGLAGTPYAAGLTNDALRNFNINWQNQQLQRQATADQAAAGLAGQQLAGVTGAGNLLSGLTTAGGGLGLSALGQQLAGTQAGANILNQLTQGGANVGLGAAQQQLANTLGGGQLYGNLVGQAANVGAALNQGQLGALTGAGTLYNQGAQGAGTLAGQVGNLANLGFGQQLAGAQGAQGLFQGALNLGQGGTALAAQAAGLPAQTYQQQQAQGLDAITRQNQIAGQGVTNLANLTNLLGAAGQYPYTGLSQLNALAQQPYAQATQEGQNALTALANQVNIGNQLFQPAQTALGNIQAYLNLGQTASGLGGQLALQNQFGTASQLAGLGALGSGIGNLFGGGSNTGGGTGGLPGLIGSLPQQAVGPTLSGDPGFLTGGSGLLGAFGNLFNIGSGGTA